MADQLNLFGVNGIGSIVKPVTSITSTPTQDHPQPNFSIEPNPALKGFRVVLAPGLTHASPKHPCLATCKKRLERITCSDCRRQYLEQIGVSPVSAVDGEGSYGFGN